MRLFLLFAWLIFYSCGPAPVKEIIDEQPNSIEEKPIEKTNWKNSSIETLKTEGFFPHFTNDGSAIIYSTSNYKGLWKYDLKSQETTELTTSDGAGFEPIISGESIIYQSKGKTTDFHELKIKNGETTKLDKINILKMAEMRAASGNPNSYATLSEDISTIEIRKKGEVIAKLSPKGDKNYINPSISPDGKKVAFEVAGLGGFISTLEGEITKELGELDQVQWVDNEHIVYSKIKDDGMQTISGNIYVQNITTGIEVALTEDRKEVFMNPSVSDDGLKIVANSSKGELIIIEKKTNR